MKKKEENRTRQRLKNRQKKMAGEIQAVWRNRKGGMKGPDRGKSKVEESLRE